MNMPFLVTWDDIAIRLVLTMLAGTALGLDRSSRGQAAGFRTTILVGLAACVAMIQANMLLPLDGKTPSSFSVMDLMRLPLGILTGVGFIGGGCILKRGDIVTGVTTAATLWIITVIGLCFGGGQILLGLVTTILASITLGLLKFLDIRFPRRHRAKVIFNSKEGITTNQLNELIGTSGYEARFQKQVINDGVKYSRFEIHWRQSESKFNPGNLLHLLEKNYNVESFDLTSEGTDLTQ